MSPRLHSSAALRVFQRALAGLCMALVLMLGAAGVSTELHAILHGHAHPTGENHGHTHDHHDHAHGDHHHHHGHAHASADHAEHADHVDEACVVNLFSQGVACAVEQPPVSAAAELGESLFHTVAERATPAKPAGLWPPPCGPPLK